MRTPVDEGWPSRNGGTLAWLPVFAAAATGCRVPWAKGSLPSRSHRRHVAQSHENRGQRQPRAGADHPSLVGSAQDKLLALQGGRAGGPFVTPANIASGDTGA
jgi:hypothetical protein